MDRKPNVVVLGGGTGMPVLLEGLKSLPIQLNVIVTVADDGGSSGKIREHKNVPAPGDVRNVVASLLEPNDELYELLQYRFQTKDELDGHALGNLLLIAMHDLAGNFYDGIKLLSSMININANIIPSVNEPVTLHAMMHDGSIVSGESNIPVYHKKIEKVFITPHHIAPVPEAVEVIQNADLIVIAPGSLYTSILPNIIFTDIVQAIQTSKAQKLYICNVMTQHGETDGYDAFDHVQAIYNHIGNDTLDAIIVHDKEIPISIQEAYAKEKSYPVTYDKKALESIGLTVIEENILDPHRLKVRHNKEKVAQLIYDYAKKYVSKG